MTKRINRLFLILAIFFIILTILVPIVDYYITKGKLIDKGQFTNVQDYIQAGVDMATQVALDLTSTYNFYAFFNENYSRPNQNSIMYKAINELLVGEFKGVITWTPIEQNGFETMFIFYILDKIMWLFVAYCIFVIPISMVDLFSKVIKKEIE